MQIIVNPHAGHGRHRKRRQELEGALRRRGIEYRFLPTRAPGHAGELARKLLARAASDVVVMGGDGTISEVAAVLACSPARMGIIGVGTGNDVARSLGLPINQPGPALDVILAGHSRRMDLGRESDRRFVSLLGIGFPAQVAEAANRMHRLKGPPAFFVAVYKALAGMKAVPARIQLDDESIELRCTSVLVQNTPYTGGGQLIAPDASIDDGLLDVVVVADIGRLNLMVNFPRVYRGTHLSHPSFTLYRTRRFRLETEAAMAQTYDGEVDGTRIRSVDVTVEEAALEVAVAPPV